jgi:hypothetical protein
MDFLKGYILGKLLFPILWGAVVVAFWYWLLH